MVLNGRHLVDIHTHVYPPVYIDLLAARTAVPYIHRPAAKSNDGGEGSHPVPRLVILPSDDSESIPQNRRGRPVDASYSSIEQKISFMDAHHIDASVISLANPWLDWVPADSAGQTARQVNDSVEAECAKYPGRLYHFGTLPLSAPEADIVAEIKRLDGLKYCRGLIMGTTGLGDGLDDDRMAPVWTAIEEAGLLVFVHPHYGLPSEVFGAKQEASGHVLPLALGFPLETTIAFVRMYVAGVFGRHPKLKLLLAHSGGTVPFLAGRVESCIVHERAFRDDQGKMKAHKSIWEVLKENIWLDGVVYSSLGVKAARDAVGSDRVMWGTDHPFFPPIGEEEGSEEWTSVSANVKAVNEAFEADEAAAAGVLGENAIKLLNLKIP